MKRLTAWLFSFSKPPLSPWRVIAWWEVRRVPFNIIVGVWGAVCLAVFFWALDATGHSQAGEVAFEPMALILAPFVINLLYTAGWVVEVAARAERPQLSPQFGPRLLKIGLAIGVSLISAPAIWWSGHRLLQIAGAVA